MAVHGLDLMTLQEYCERVGVSYKTAVDAANAGTLPVPAFKMHDRWFLVRKSYHQWLQSRMAT